MRSTLHTLHKLQGALALFVAAALTLVLFAQLAYAADSAADPDVGSLLLELYKDIAAGAWYPVAGVGLSFLVLGVRYLLGKKWPTLLTSDRWGVAITAALAGTLALAHAWIADADVDTTTLKGAFNVWAVAVAGFVTTKRLLAPKTPDAPAPASAAPAPTPDPAN